MAADDLIVVCIILHLHYLRVCKARVTYFKSLKVKHSKEIRSSFHFRHIHPGNASWEDVPCNGGMIIQLVKLPWIHTDLGDKFYARTNTNK